MGIYKAEAIVLRSFAYGEADRILTLFTREMGKISAIAKGVRKTKSRLRGAVQLFSHTSLVLYAGRNLDTVSQGEAEEEFCYLQKDVERFTTASYCAELVDRLTEESQALPGVFELLLSAFRSLESGDPELLARVFELKLLSLLGYRPVLTGCVQGDHPLQTEGGQQIWFSIPMGGVLCPACASTCRDKTPLSPATLGALGYFLRAPLKQAIKVRIGAQSLRELATFLQGFIAYHGDVSPRSRFFLSSFQNGAEPPHQA
jgi:DNA repair protein RecO (recombination protein O)